LVPGFDGSPSQTGGSFGAEGHAEGGIAAPNEVIEIAVDDASAGLQQQVRACASERYGVLS
jgi:hypothetical protein